MLPLHPDVVATRVSRFRLDWMSHVFEAGLKQSRQSEPTPQALIEKGLGSVYAQLWAKIVDGNVPAIPDSDIAAILHTPPAPKPLAVEAGTESDHEAATEKPAEPPPRPPAQEDWETDVVLEGVVGSNAPRGSGGTK